VGPEERFEIEGEAGAGGMGTVYRARDRETGRLVALKVLQRQQGDDAALWDEWGLKSESDA
jgi:serine/threonine protein kinase